MSLEIKSIKLERLLHQFIRGLQEKEKARSLKGEFEGSSLFGDMHRQLEEFLRTETSSFDALTRFTNYIQNQISQYERKENTHLVNELRNGMRDIEKAVRACTGKSIPWSNLEQSQAPEQDVQQAMEVAPASPKAADWRNNESLTKGEKQRLAIREAITLKGYKPFAIPDGGKVTLEALCQAEYPDIFDEKTSFSNAWRAGNKKYWRMANYASFAKRWE
jgi:hypothetical protein